MKRLAQPRRSVSIAYLLRFPIAQAPNPLLVDFFYKMTLRTGVEIRFVMSERLTGAKQTFEAYPKSEQEFKAVKDFLTTYGFYFIPSRFDASILHCSKGRVRFILVCQVPAL
jgi:hypothetical protein